MKIKIIGTLSYAIFPISEDMIEVKDDVLKEIGKTKCFDVKNKKVIDYVRPEKTLEQKLKEYSNLVEQYIRQKYSVSAEIAIIRQRDSKPEEFEEYYSYAESCKIIAKEKLGLTEV